jgi:hypothetical protein
MDIVKGVLIAISGIVGSIAVHLISDDIHEFAPKLAARLVRSAVLSLPEYDRQRYEEEWLAHLADCSGSLMKLLQAAGCLLGSYRLARLLAQRPIRLEVGDRVIALDSPSAIMIMWLLHKNEADDYLRKVTAEAVSAYARIDPKGRPDSSQIRAVYAALKTAAENNPNSIAQYRMRFPGPQTKFTINERGEIVPKEE